ncbi:MAG TPA: DinB family protein, partial [Nocardioides sp.]|nr:DinB family protein [Nocardioides sp.]
AAEALARLDTAYDAWTAGVESLGEEGLSRPCGPSEGPFAEAPLADLVLHLNRELIHHGAEICLLRDLYLRRKDLS